MSRQEQDPNRARMSDLAETFPILRGRQGVRPFDPDALDRMAAGPEGTSGLRCAARFVLNVWNGVGQRARCHDKHGNRSALRSHWRVGPFDLFEAWACWSEGERRAASAWLRAPFWP